MLDCSLSKPKVDSVPEILYLPPLPSTTNSGDAKTWRLIFSEPLLLPQRSNPPGQLGKLFVSRLFVPEVTFDLLEALELDPAEDYDKTPTPSLNMAESNNEGSDSSDDISHNIKQLIQETDKAFQAVGIALADMKATQESQDSGIAEQVTRTIGIPRGIPKKQQSTTNVSLKTPISRTKSTGKPQRTAFYRKRLDKLTKAAPKAIHIPSHTRWTDVTNMVDVLSGKMFRTEVDEMLTPKRRRELLLDMKIETESKVSLEQTRSPETSRSSSTVSLESRTNSARNSTLSMVSPVSPPTPIGPTITIAPPTPISPKGKEREIFSPDTVGQDDSGMVFDNLKFPSPPQAPPLPHRSSLRPKPHRSATLPTITESSPLTSSMTRKADPPPLPPLPIPPPRYSSTHITLPSTKFTLTSPLFAHGAIRVERPRHDALQDEALDWTAFQMAISGMDDDDETEYELEHRHDEQQVDELVRWWEDFDMEMGEMIRGPPPRSKRIVVYTKDENNRELPWRAGERGRLSGGTWGVRMEEEEHRGKEGKDRENGSRSPVTGWSGGKDGFQSPPMKMGFNLNQDLGDFLNWEVQHVAGM